MATLSIEARVGAFVLAALALLAAFIMALGDVRLTPGFEFQADYGFSGGLQPGAPIKVSGVEVGRVAELRILGDKPQPPRAAKSTDLGRTVPALVRARLVVDREYSHLVTDESRLYIGTQGVIGESYVELSPGFAGIPVEAGAAIRGVDAPQLHLVALHGSVLLSAIGSLVGIDQELGTGGVGDALKELISAVSGIVGERRAELSRALGDLAVTAGDLRKITARGRHAIGDGSALRSLLEDASASAALLRKDLPGLLERAGTSMAALEELTAKTNQAVDAKQVEEFLGDLRRTMENLQKVALDAQQVMSTIRRGQGTVGGLVTDPQVYDDLKEMLRDLKKNPWKLFWRD